MDRINIYMRHRCSRVVRFAEMAQLHLYSDGRHEVAGHVLWYTKLELKMMRLAAQEEALTVLAKALAGNLAIDAGNEDTDSAKESCVCSIGLEQFISRAVLRLRRGRKH